MVPPQSQSCSAVPAVKKLQERRRERKAQTEKLLNEPSTFIFRQDIELGWMGCVCVGGGA